MSQKISLNAQADHVILISREGEPSTKLEFRCSTITAMTMEEVLSRVQSAVTDWIIETDEGKRAWQDSVEDFNVGDLSLELCAQLHEHLRSWGILNVSVSSPDHDVCPAWNYDTVLAERSRLEGLAS
jgi:hypothetical protein